MLAEQVPTKPTLVPNFGGISILTLSSIPSFFRINPYLTLSTFRTKTSDILQLLELKQSSLIPSSQGPTGASPHLCGIHRTGRESHQSGEIRVAALYGLFSSRTVVNTANDFGTN